MKLQIEEFYSVDERDAVAAYLTGDNFTVAIEGWLDDYTTWEISWITFDLKEKGIDFWWEFDELEIPIDVSQLLELPVTRHTWQEA